MAQTELKRVKTCYALNLLSDNTDAGAAAPVPRTNTDNFLELTVQVRRKNLEKRDVRELMDALDQTINIVGDRTAAIQDVQATFSIIKNNMGQVDNILTQILIGSLVRDDTVINILRAGIFDLERKRRIVATPKTSSLRTMILANNAAPKMVSKYDSQILALKRHLSCMMA